MLGLVRSGTVCDGQGCGDEGGERGDVKVQRETM
jgi:hypothetical protein